MTRCKSRQRQRHTRYCRPRARQSHRPRHRPTAEPGRAPRSALTFLRFRAPDDRRGIAEHQLNQGRALAAARES